MLRPGHKYVFAFIVITLYSIELIIVNFFNDDMYKFLQNNKNVYVTTNSSVAISGQDELIPLGGRSNSTLAICNESGKIITLATDKYGFHNNDEQWDEENDFVIAGESFSQGYCSNPYEEHYVEFLRKDYKVLNLSVWGNGPLSKLAALREYLPHIKTKNIIFTYTANDIDRDLTAENETLLTEYLDEEYTQRLFERQNEIDKLILKNTRIEDVKRRSFNKTCDDFSCILKLENTSRRLFSVYRSIVRPGNIKKLKHVDYGSSGLRYLKQYEKILSELSSLAKLNGVTVYFLYIPLAETFMVEDNHEQVLKNTARLHKKILTMATRHNFHVLDLHSYIASKESPLDYYVVLRYPFNYGHFESSKHKEIYDYMKKHFR